jgi:integrase
MAVMNTKVNEPRSTGNSVLRYVWHNPGKIIDRNGRLVVTAGSVWLLNNVPEDLQINWNLIDTATDVKDAMKAYVAYGIEAKSPGAAWTEFNHIKYCIEQLPPISSIDDLTYPRLEAVLVQLRASNSAWKFGHLRRWYRWESERRIPGFDKEIAARLYRLKVSTNVTGEAVKTRDPEKGPLDDQEFWLLKQAIKQGKGPLLDRICVMLPLELGLRPAQAVWLEEGDLKIERAKSGQEFFSLDVVRLKQGTVGTPAKKRRRISPELGHALRQLIEENRKLYGDGGPDAPILRSLTEKPPDGGVMAQSNDEERRVRRMTRLVFTGRVRAYPYKVNIISPRTRRILKLFPYRLRYTFGTRHGNQGTPAYFLAEMLDHSTIDSVRVYTNSSSTLVERLNVSLGNDEQYTNTLTLFFGMITERTGDEAPHIIIYGTTPTYKNLGGIGACGANYLCKLLPPLSCYVCPKFQAWSDGPHEQVLRELESHTENLIARTTRNPSDRIPHQLTDAIAAVKALLKKIDEYEEGKKKS